MKQSVRFSRYLVDRHAFIKLKHSVVIIQRAVRFWITQKKKQTDAAALIIQKFIRGSILRKSFLNKKQAATIIQSRYRAQVLRKNFFNQKQATIKIQNHYRGFITRKCFLSQKQAATKIQSRYRGWVSRNHFLKMKQAVIILQRSIKCLRNLKHYKLEIKSAVIIQSHTRGWITCKEFLLQKKAATRIQTAFRCYKCFKNFNCYTNSAVIIQQFVRDCIARKKIIGKSRSCIQEDEKLVAQKRTKSAILIQSNVRGWIARRKTAQRRQRIAVIQSYWKGYIERKKSKGKLCDIRLRVKKAAANVDDGMRIINRLIAALSELKNMKSVSGILHTCATIDMATKHSQKCCEKLVDAGAINTLLELIRSISRSIVDQQVLRHVFSIFRNITRHPHLNEAVIHTCGSAQIILWEFIRNKEDACFLAADVLRNMCSNKKGVDRLRDLYALVKRLHNLVEELKRKAGNEKRNLRTAATKEQKNRRFKEATQILKLITNG